MPPYFPFPKPYRVALASLLLFAAFALACGDSASSPPTTTESVTIDPSVVAVITSTPVPTAAALPATTLTPTVAAAPPSEGIAPEAKRLADEAWARLVDLTENHSPRASGSDEEADAAAHLRDVLTSLGYETTLQPFTFHTVKTEAASMGANSARFQAIPLDFSARGEVEGALEYVGLAQDGDVPEDGLAGKVALIERGIITFEEKIKRVAAAGAVGTAIYNHSAGLYRGSLQAESAIPAVSVSREDSVELLELAKDPDVTFLLSISDHEAPSHNVIADKPGTGDGVVVLGAHYDTVPDSPGANDNGSGIATVLTVASELAYKSLPFALRIVLFGGEEEGLHGSIHYVQSISSDEQEQILAMLNFDALGSGPVIAVLGSGVLASTVMDYGERHDITVERRLDIGPFTSDHAPFDNVGVPVLFFLADDFSRINSPDDVIEFVEPLRMGEAAALAIGLLRDLAEER